MSNLTPKQEQFCREYVIDFNATQAAIRAGYSENGAEVQGCRMLSNANIQELIKSLQDTTAEKLQITKEMIVENIKSIAFSETAKDRDRLAGSELLGKVLGIFEKDNRQKTDNITIKVSRKKADEV